MNTEYVAAHLETAATLWEAVLEMKETHPPVKAAFERIGTSHLRLITVGWTLAADAEWAKVKETNWDTCWDWDWIPALIEKHVDWSAHEPMWIDQGVTQ